MNVLCELCHEYAEKELQVIPGTIANNNYFCLVTFSFVYCKFIRVHVIFAMTDNGLVNGSKNLERSRGSWVSTCDLLTHDPLTDD